MDFASIDPATLTVEEQLVTALELIGDGRQGARYECAYFIQSVHRAQEFILEEQKQGRSVPKEFHRLYDQAGRLHPGVSRRMLGYPFEEDSLLNQSLRPERGTVLLFDEDRWEALSGLRRMNRQEVVSIN